MKIKHPTLNAKVHDRDGYFFTHKDMIIDHLKFWEPILADTPSPCNILEIGSLQGNSAIYWLNNFNCQLWCVEPFGRTKSVPDKELFLENICKTGKKDKVNLIELKSDDFFSSKPDIPLLDIIYVDGSHEADFVARDCINAYQYCKIGGIIIMDDYKMPRVFADDKIGPKPSIDSFLEKYDDKIEVLHIGYQVIVKKL